MSDSRICSTSISQSIITDNFDQKQFQDLDDFHFIIVGQKLAEDSAFVEAIKCLDIPLIFCSNISQYDIDPEDGSVFILDEFKGQIFNLLHKMQCKIIGPTAVMSVVKKEKEFPCRIRPLYSLSMDNLVLCFSGIRSKDVLSKMVDLVHYMGGCIKKEMSAKVTHLVTNRTGREKYKVAVSFGIDIMSEDWILFCWDLRHDPLFKAEDPKIISRFKLLPFSYCLLSFYGFSKNEQNHLEEITLANGGQVVDEGSPSATHLVVNAHEVTKFNMDKYYGKIYIVKAEWLWASIQMEACADECIYLYEGIGDEENTPSSIFSHKSTIQSVTNRMSKSQRRKRLQENIAQLAFEGEQGLCKRLSLEKACKSSGLLDSSELSDNTILQDITQREKELTPVNKKTSNLTSRQHTIIELLQTETNYVLILNTILKTFRDAIESADQPGGPILDSHESKSIFGGIAPIQDAHFKIKTELNYYVQSWDDRILIGDIFLKNSDALIKSYPTFVNYFEQTKESIIKYDKTKPRFHAFLKLCQSKVECGRQSLDELMIRPVQRLPSVLLLLKDICKRTEKSHPDFNKLEKAIAAIEEILKHINEDKRKAEKHKTMFDVVESIQNCPANILSAHREFKEKLDTVEVSDILCGRGDTLTLFIFSDSIEICKRRSKQISTKSPISSFGSRSLQKIYKHLHLLPFSSIRRILNIEDSHDCKDVFALISKQIDEDEEKLFVFALSNTASNKIQTLVTLSKTICSNTCRTNYESLIANVDSDLLSISTLDLFGYNSLSRAANKFSKRVSRALSITKSPTSGMKRAISSMAQMMTPEGRGMSHALSIASLQSYTSINTLGSLSSLAQSEWNETKSCNLDEIKLATPDQHKRRETIIHSLDNVNILTTPRKNRQSIIGSISSRLTTFKTPTIIEQKETKESILNLKDKKDVTLPYSTFKPMDFKATSKKTNTLPTKKKKVPTTTLR